MTAAREFLKTCPLESLLMLLEDNSIAIDLDAQSEFVDAATFLQVWKAHPQDYAARIEEIRKRIENEEYGVIVINSEDGSLLQPRLYWEPSIILAIKEHYRTALDFINDRRSHDIYLPRSVAGQRSPFSSD